MKIEDLNDPNANMLGGQDFNIWLIFFGVLVVIAVVLAFLNRNQERED